MSTCAARNWLITGASTGFGREAARRIAEAGGLAIATARNVERLDDLVEMFPDNIVPMRLDVTRPSEIADAVRESEARGGIDVLFNNAAYGLLGGVEESLEEEIRQEFDVNFCGALRMIRAVLPGMRRRKSGFILNVSSISGVQGFLGSGFYSASKFALEGLSETLALEVAPFGINVMIVEPGPFRTDFSRSIQTTRRPLPEYPHLAERRVSRAARPPERGDPARALDAIITALDAPQQPQRLVLGTEAYDVVKRALEKRMRELEVWRDLGQATDFVDEPKP